MAQILYDVVVDGYVIVSTKLEVLAESGANFPGPFVEYLSFVQSVTENDYKGVKRLYKLSKQTTSGLQLNLSRCTNRQFSILVTPIEDVAYVNPALHKDEIKEAYIAGFESGLRVPEVESSRTNSRLPKINKSKIVTIYQQHYQRFGRALLAQMNADLAPLQLRACFLWSDLGPIGYLRKHDSGETDEVLEKTLRNFELCHAEEIVIHIARDYFAKEHCILWEKIKGDIPFKGTPSYFHNLLTGHKYSSSEFAIYKDYREKDRRDAHIYESCLRHDQPHYASLKFYISPLKEVHLLTQCGQPWKGAMAEKALTLIPSLATPASQRGDDCKKPADLLKWIELTESSVNLLSQKTHSEARFEAILRKNCNYPSTITNESILWHFRNYFETKFPNEEISNRFALFPYRDLIEQNQNTIVVALNSLKSIVQKSIENRARGEFLASIPDHREVQRAMICEAIICVCVYGNINYRAPSRELEYFNRDMVKHLNLRYAERTRPIAVDADARGAWLRLDQLSRDLRVVTISLETPPSFSGRTMKVIDYQGPYFLDPLIWQNIKQETNDGNDNDDLQKLHSAFISICSRNLDSPVQEFNDAFKDVAEVFWNAVSIYAGQHISGRVNPDLLQEPRVIEQAIEEHSDLDIKYETSLQFVENFFRTPENYSQIGLAHLIRNIKRHFARKKSLMVALEKEMICCIDLHLFRSLSLALFYPTNTAKGIWTLVLPCFRHQDDSFRLASEHSQYFGRNEVKQKIIENYYYNAFKACYPSGQNILESGALHIPLLENSFLEYCRKKYDAVQDIWNAALDLQIQHELTLF